MSRIERMVRGNKLLRDYRDQLCSHPLVRSAHNILLGYQELIRKMIPLRILESHNAWHETNRLLSEFVNDYFREVASKKAIDILEAGCGQQWNLNLEIDYVLTGVDLSREAMMIRKKQYDDIDNFIVGDLATVLFDKDTFDLIYCSFVLEHLRGAEAVLDRFFKWLRPGGLVILIFPDGDSVYGSIVKRTPHWFHVFYYKYILKWPNAGEPGHNPFPTNYDTVVSRRGIHEFLHTRGYKIALEFATPTWIPQSEGPIGWLISLGVKLVAIISFGRLTDRHQNLALIIKKP